MKRLSLLYCLASVLIVFTLAACSASIGSLPAGTQLPPTSQASYTPLPTLIVPTNTAPVSTRTPSPQPTPSGTLELPAVVTVTSAPAGSSLTPATGRFPSLGRIQMFDAQHGWAIAGQTDFQMLHTEDGGQTWRNVMPIPHSRIETPENVFFLDASTVFVVLKKGGNGAVNSTFFRTQDGGQTWQSWSAPFRDAKFTFFDANNGWAAADLACPDACRVTLYRTQDGGKTWSLLADATSPFGATPGKGRIPNNLFFQNATSVWLREDVSTLFVSRDAGKTWQQKQPPLKLPEATGNAPWASMPEFLNQQDGFFYVFLTEKEMVVFSTSDGGDTWTALPVHIDAGQFGGEGHFTTARDWFFDCGDRLCATHDAGKTWQLPPYKMGASGDTRVMAIDFLDPAAGWALVYLPEMGGDYTLFHTDDGGLNWQRMQPHLVGNLVPTLAPYPTAPVANLPVFTSTPEPTIVVPPGAFPRVYMYRFVDTQTAFVTAWPWIDPNTSPGPSPNRLLRSSDGAKTWQDVTPRGVTDGWLTGILNANTFWVVSHPQDAFSGKDTLYRTSDGGKTWKKITAPFAMGSIQMLDGKNAWAVASPGGCGAGTCWSQFYFSSDGGLTWTLYHPQPPLHADSALPEGTIGLPSGAGIRFTSPDTLWVGGGFSDYGPPELLVSRDRGQTWQTIRFDLPESMRPVTLHLPTFLNENEGFLTITVETGPPRTDGNNHRMQAIFATSDGGRTWTPRPSLDFGDWSSSVSFVTVKDWFAYCNGALCRTNDGGQTWQALPSPRIAGAIYFSPGPFFDSKNGYAIARFTAPDNQEVQQIFVSHDGGQSWSEVEQILK